MRRSPDPSTDRLGQVLSGSVVLRAPADTEGRADSAPFGQAATVVSAANYRPQSAFSEGVASAGAAPQVKGEQEVGWQRRTGAACAAACARCLPKHFAISTPFSLLRSRCSESLSGSLCPRRGARWPPTRWPLATRGRRRVRVLQRLLCCAVRWPCHCWCRAALDSCRADTRTR